VELRLLKIIKPRKLAENGANPACVEDKIVFGWAIHHFEENSIIGVLYNEDGSKIEPETPKAEPTKQTKASVKKQDEKQQATLFDLFDNSTKNTENLEKIEGKTQKIDDFIKNSNEKPKIIQEERKFIDTETGEVLEDNSPKTCSVDKEFAIILSALLDNNLEVKL